VEAIREWPPNLPPRSADLEALIGFTEKRTIGPSGIDLFTLRYNCAELAALRRNLEKGEKVTVRYDPQDISVIYVHDQVGDRMIPVPALAQDYTRKLTIWQHHVIRKYTSRTVRDCVDVEALCRAKEKIQQIVERERWLKGKMKGKQKVAHYLDLGQRISAGDPEGIETNGQLPSDPIPSIPIKAEEAAGDIESPADHPISPVDLDPSRESGVKKKLSKSSMSSKQKALREPSPFVAQALPLDQQGWSADYSLPVGSDTGSGEEVR
jgi:putative transposase